MVRTLGVFHEHHRSADFLWNHCAEQGGTDSGLVIQSGNREADHILVMNYIVGPDGLRRSRSWRRTWYKLTRRSTTPLRICPGYEWLDRDPRNVWALAYEPQGVTSDWYYEYTRSRCSRVYGPDPRATHPCVLPAMWTIEDHVEALRFAPPPPKPWPLATVTSGKQLIAGHGSRLAFLKRLRDAGLPLRLFGRALPGELMPSGQVASKATVLRPARLALVIENDAAGEQYVSEKIWDALLCWCLPVYFGSGAVDSLIPSGSFIRLPDLEDRGFEVLRQAIESKDAWERAAPAIADARRRVLDDLNIIQWIKRELWSAAL
jgi:hypothetical protein